MSKTSAASSDMKRRLFFGRRKGRKLRTGQNHLIAELLPRLQIELPKAGALDLASLFGRDLDRLWLEIGFGGGEHLAHQAEAHPDVGIMGSEVFINGIASILGHIDARKLENVRLYPEDARDLLDVLPKRCLERVFLLFPDPWPKRRHAERRFVNPTNLDRLAELMKPQAEFRVASDDPIYITWALRHLTEHPAFEWLASGPEDWKMRTSDWPPTRYEQKALREGRKPVYLRFRRKGGD